MKQKYGFELEVLDFGGGFAVQYTGQPGADIGFFATESPSAWWSAASTAPAPPSLTIEPGGAIVGQAGLAFYRAGPSRILATAAYVAWTWAWPTTSPGAV
jgi:diaminopimelate decarboxylase